MENNGKSDRELDLLRDEIDRADRELIDLLARRREVVTRIAALKTARGLPVYAPDREEVMLRARRREAAERGVHPELIEDILRRIMRDSYRAEGEHGYRRAAPEAWPVVLVGGAGGMGRLFARHFTASGHPVRILDRDDWSRADELLDGAGLVLVGVPIAVTLDVLDDLRGRLPAGAVLADITSVKVAPLARMLEIHDGPVVGLHPMFGHSAPSLAKQVFAHCPGRDAAACSWLLDQLRIWGAFPVTVEPAVHDRLMGAIQAQRHFATFVYGLHLMEEQTDLDEVLALSSPIYRLELGMIGRLFAQAPDLYADIIFGSEVGRDLARRYHRLFARMLDIYESGDRAAFLADFARVKDWLGPLADVFLAESDALLDQARDRLDIRAAGATRRRGDP
ncbi:bifunctional chorismate mutase/prephenate dehydrogenase [bacterium]|nr:bifunctional chorismate mutase/prephenate dehydrogenase [bacterium]MBU1073581.1 bifunctional chorismate mutase/prephenate dehydrogenase [bacterium]MBU1674579.1 bifunctional chorismate mutase/prephenate dehydrogenase [bacterium]